jgi:hypothetical protein
MRVRSQGRAFDLAERFARRDERKAESQVARRPTSPLQRTINSLL